MSQTLYTVMTQDVVFDGPTPKLLEPSAALYLLTHYSYASLDEAREDGCQDAHKFRIRMRIDYEEIGGDHAA